MNNDTKILDLPSLVGDLFTQHGLQVDNLNELGSDGNSRAARSHHLNRLLGKPVTDVATLNRTHTLKYF